MLTSLNSLSVRNIETPFNFEAFGDLEHKLPPIYKLFLSTYDIFDEYPRDPNLINMGLLVPGDEYLSGFGEEHCPYAQEKWGFNFSINKFFDFRKTPSQLIISRLYSEYDERDHIILQSGLLPFADAPGNNFFLIGIEPNNLDKIYFDNPHAQNRLTHVAENIFELYRILETNVYPTKKFGNDFSRLYRNWNEPFWRIRGESDDTPPPNP